MYTVMIVEDEMLVRMGLMVSIPWTELGLHVVAEETNGTDAWESYKKYHPDIIMTDIRIPGINGMELMGKIRAVDATCAMIVITCVEEFKVLQKTIELDVVAYLVKATMKQKDIVESVHKAMHYLQSHHRVGREDGNDISMESVLTQYFSNEAKNNRELCKRAENEIGESLSGFLFLHLSRTAGITDMLRKSVKNILQERLSALDVVVLPNIFDCVLVLIRNKVDPKALYTVVGGIHNYCKDIFALNINFDVCPNTVKVESLPDAAERMARDYGKEYLYNSAMLAVDEDGRINDPAVNECLEILKSNLWLLRDENSVTEIRGKIDALEREIGSDWVALCNAAYFLAQYICSHSKSIPANTLQTYGNLLKNHVGMRALFEGLTELIVKPAVHAQNMRSEVGKAIQYMVKNHQEELSLTRVAAEVGLHPTYFSRVFKNEVGWGFSDFVTIIRLDRAMELLKTTNKSIQEISGECGFSDVSYFCRKFKAATGTAPNLWRKK